LSGIAVSHSKEGSIRLEARKKGTIEGGIKSKLVRHRQAREVEVKRHLGGGRKAPSK